ncbi:hypothetical protein L9F63_010738, partial [Diploptera punctata]
LCRYVYSVGGAALCMRLAEIQLTTLQQFQTLLARHSGVKSSDWWWQTSTCTQLFPYWQWRASFSLYPSYNLNFRAGEPVAKSPIFPYYGLPIYERVIRSVSSGLITKNLESEPRLIYYIHDIMLLAGDHPKPIDTMTVTVSKSVSYNNMPNITETISMPQLNEKQDDYNIIYHKMILLYRDFLMMMRIQTANKFVEKNE